jgi:hypothetical protein
LDLETYISRYSGETRLQRLLWIAQTTPDETLSIQAFDLAEQQLRQDGNTNRYKEVFGGGGGGGEAESASTNNIRKCYISTIQAHTVIVSSFLTMHACIHIVWILIVNYC